MALGLFLSSLRVALRSMNTAGCSRWTPDEQGDDKRRVQYPSFFSLAMSGVS